MPTERSDSSHYDDLCSLIEPIRHPGVPVEAYYVFAGQVNHALQRGSITRAQHDGLMELMPMSADQRAFCERLLAVLHDQQEPTP